MVETLGDEASSSLSIRVRGRAPRRGFGVPAITILDRFFTNGTGRDVRPGYLCFFQKNKLIVLQTATGNSFGSSRICLRGFR